MPTRPVIAALSAVASGVIVVVVALYTGWRLLGVEDETLIVTMTDLTIPVIGTLATALAWAAARFGDRRDARAWRLMALAFTAYLAGDLLWSAFELVAGETPDVSLADVFYLLFYPAALAALIMVSGPERTRAQRVQMVLDGLMLVVLGAVVEWLFVIGPVLEDITADALGTAVALAYPIGDIVLLFAIGVVATRRRLAWRNLSLVLLGAAVASNMLGDLASGSAWVVEGFTTGSTPDLFFIGFWLFAGAAAYAEIRLGPTQDEFTTPRDRQPADLFWMPYVAAVLVIALPLVLFLGHSQDKLAVAGFGALTMSVLILVRQVIGARAASRAAVAAERLASEARLASVLRQVSDLVLVVDAGGTVRFASAASIATLGRSPEATADTRLVDLADPADGEAIEKFLARAFAGEDVSAGLAWRVRDVAPTVHLEATASTLSDHQDQKAIILACRDVSERLRQEAERAEVRRLQAVGRLAGGIAHEFNNLLTGIGGYTELMLQEVEPGNSRHDDLLRIQEATDRAAQLTRQLLAVGQRQWARFRPVDVGGVVRSCEPQLAALAADRIDLTVHVEPGLPPVLADPHQLCQVLLDLAANACDAMANGGVLRIRAYRAPATTRRPGSVPNHPAGWVGLSVDDTGAGMDAQTLSHLFEPFFTTKGQGRGTGLGLASAYGTLTVSGGWIDVKSEPGEGSAFRTFWPVAMPGAATPDVAGSELEATAPVATRTAEGPDARA